MAPNYIPGIAIASIILLLVLIILCGVYQHDADISTSAGISAGVVGVVGISLLAYLMYGNPPADVANMLDYVVRNNYDYRYTPGTPEFTAQYTLARNRAEYIQLDSRDKYTCVQRIAVQPYYNTTSLAGIYDIVRKCVTTDAGDIFADDMVHVIGAHISPHIVFDNISVRPVYDYQKYLNWVDDNTIIGIPVNYCGYNVDYTHRNTVGYMIEQLLNPVLPGCLSTFGKGQQNSITYSRELDKHISTPECKILPLRDTGSTTGHEYLGVSSGNASRDVCIRVANHLKKFCVRIAKDVDTAARDRIVSVAYMSTLSFKHTGDAYITGRHNRILSILVTYSQFNAAIAYAIDNNQNIILPPLGGDPNVAEDFIKSRPCDVFLALVLAYSTQCARIRGRCPIDVGIACPIGTAPPEYSSYLELLYAAQTVPGKHNKPVGSKAHKPNALVCQQIVHYSPATSDDNCAIDIDMPAQVRRSIAAIRRRTDIRDNSWCANIKADYLAATLVGGIEDYIIFVATGPVYVVFGEYPIGATGMPLYLVYPHNSQVIDTYINSKLQAAVDSMSAGLLRKRTAANKDDI